VQFLLTPLLVTDEVEHLSSTQGVAQEFLLEDYVLDFLHAVEPFMGIVE
jgi:hypothetical protein